MKRFFVFLAFVIMFMLQPGLSARAGSVGCEPYEDGILITSDNAVIDLSEYTTDLNYTVDEVVSTYASFVPSGPHDTSGTLSFSHPAFTRPLYIQPGISHFRLMVAGGSFLRTDGFYMVKTPAQNNPAMYFPFEIAWSSGDSGLTFKPAQDSHGASFIEIERKFVYAGREIVGNGWYQLPSGISTFTAYVVYDCYVEGGGRNPIPVPEGSSGYIDPPMSTGSLISSGATFTFSWRNIENYETFMAKLLGDAIPNYFDLKMQQQFNQLNSIYQRQYDYGEQAHSDSTTMRTQVQQFQGLVDTALLNIYRQLMTNDTNNKAGHAATATAVKVADTNNVYALGVVQNKQDTQIIQLNTIIDRLTTGGASASAGTAHDEMTTSMGSYENLEGSIFTSSSGHADRMDFNPAMPAAFLQAVAFFSELVMIIYNALGSLQIIITIFFILLFASIVLGTWRILQAFGGGGDD